MRRIFFITFLVSIYCMQMFAIQPQAPEKVIYNNKEYKIFSTPMEPFFQKNPTQRPKITSPYLWRGYVTTFEVIQKELFIKDMQEMVAGTDMGSPWNSIMNKVFQGKTNVKAVWVNAVMSLPSGRVTGRDYMDNSLYEEYILLEVENGNVVFQKTLNEQQYTVFKNEQFNKFKNTSDYKQVANQIITNNPTATTLFVDATIENDIFNYLTKILK